MLPNPARQPLHEILAVDYAQPVLSDIEVQVTKGFDRLARGGVEVGGVLFGRYSHFNLAVLAAREASCTYAQGPLFVFGAHDHHEFQRTLKLHESDPELAGLIPVGWYLSHVRDSLVLRVSDQELFDRYFDQPWHIALVIRTGRVGSLRAATLLRASSGEPNPLVNEFTIKHVRNAAFVSPRHEEDVVPVRVVPPPPSLDLPVPEVPVRVRERPLQVRPGYAPPARVPAAHPAPQVQRVIHRSGRQWQGLIAVAFLLVLIVLATTVYLEARSPENLGLQAFDRDGVMLIEWNAANPLVTHAKRAQLHVTDGDTVVDRDLTPAELRHGLYATIRDHADYTARLRLFDSFGNVHEELTRYVGRPIARAEAIRQTIDDLKHQNDNLQQELLREQARAAELESRVRIQQEIIQRSGNR